jgi:hypothetical protein
VKRRVAHAALAIALVLGQAGCWSFQLGAKAYDPRDIPEPFAEGAILRVNEAGVAWGNGIFGQDVQQGMLRAGLFERVYYPVEPPDPPEYVVEVTALGNLDEAILWALLASAATGYFFFMPAPVMPYFEDYGVTCDVQVRRGSELLHQFQVETEANVVHAIFADPEKFVTDARTRVFRHLASRIVEGVAETKFPPRPAEPDPL